MVSSSRKTSLSRSRRSSLRSGHPVRLSGEPDRDRAGMGVERLRPPERDRRRTERRERPRVALEQRGALHEIEHPEPRGDSAPSAPSAARGWSRRHSRRSLRAYRAPRKIAPALTIRSASASGSRVMISRCSGASRSTSGSAASSDGREDDRAVVAPARAGDFFPRQFGELAFDLGRDRARERRVVGDQDRLRGRRRARPGRGGRRRRNADRRCDRPG